MRRSHASSRPRWTGTAASTPWSSRQESSAYGRFEDVPVEVFDGVLRTNLLGSANLARHVVPVLRRQRRGHLVLIGSVIGDIATPYMAAYAVSKWGIRALGRHLAIENRDLPDVHVSVVSPGGVDTPIYESAANYLGVPGRPPPPVTTPERVAKAVLRVLERPRDRRQVGLANRLMRGGFTLFPAVYDVLVGRLLAVAALDRTTEAARGSGFGPRPGLPRPTRPAPDRGDGDPAQPLGGGAGTCRAVLAALVLRDPSTWGRASTAGAAGYCTYMLLLLGLLIVVARWPRSGFGLHAGLPRTTWPSPDRSDGDPAQPLGGGAATCRAVLAALCLESPSTWGSASTAGASGYCADMLLLLGLLIVVALVVCSRPLPEQPQHRSERHLTRRSRRTRDSATPSRRAIVSQTSGSSTIPRWVDPTSTCSANGEWWSRQLRQLTTPSRRLRITVTGTSNGCSRSRRSTYAAIRRASGCWEMRAPAVWVVPPTSGVPKVTTCETRSGRRRATSRTTTPPRLQPTSDTGPSSAERGRRHAARVVSRHHGRLPGFARSPSHGRRGRAGAGSDAAVPSTTPVLPTPARR